jgi:hypothetical protein
MDEEYTMPRVGEGWRHHKGGLYKIVGIGHDTTIGDAVVIYSSDSHHSPSGLWVRPLSEFLGYTEDHQQRFYKEREAR